jgi:hypothetical protein
MIAITTNSSINVNAFLRLELIVVSLFCEMEAEMPGAPPESGPAPADTIGEARSQADAFSSKRISGEASYAAAWAAVSPLVTDSLPAQHDDQAD